MDFVCGSAVTVEQHFSYRVALCFNIMSSYM